MRSWAATGNTRLSVWRRVREFAVPLSMIESATARRNAGDWAGACSAARFDVDVNPRAVARKRGRELAAWIWSDLRRLAPDLLRWHLPRVGPDGLLRPGLTVSLARYRPADGGEVHLVARTPPAWADAGQRVSLALWDGSPERPRARPDRRFRLDLHRHLWDASRAGELCERSGASLWLAGNDSSDPDHAGPVPPGAAGHRWAAEAALLLHADRRLGEPVTIRLGAGRRLVLDVEPEGLPGFTVRPATAKVRAGPVLPDAATWVLPDLELLRHGLIDRDRLHPMVAQALFPGAPPSGGPPPAVGAEPQMVECRGARHRIGLANGVLVPLDHDPDDIRREELLAALGGAPMPCLHAIDTAHRRPELLVDISARLDHGDTVGALAVVESLLGPAAMLRDGPLREELEAAALRRLNYGLFRSGLIGCAAPTGAVRDARRRNVRSHPRHASAR